MEVDELVECGESDEAALVDRRQTAQLVVTILAESAVQSYTSKSRVCFGYVVRASVQRLYRCVYIIVWSKRYLTRTLCRGPSI